MGWGVDHVQLETCKENESAGPRLADNTCGSEARGQLRGRGHDSSVGAILDENHLGLV